MTWWWEERGSVYHTPINCFLHHPHQLQNEKERRSGHGKEYPFKNYRCWRCCFWSSPPELTWWWGSPLLKESPDEPLPRVSDKISALETLSLEEKKWRNEEISISCSNYTLVTCDHLILISSQLISQKNVPKPFIYDWKTVHLIFSLQQTAWRSDHIFSVIIIMFNRLKVFFWKKGELLKKEMGGNSKSTANSAFHSLRSVPISKTSFWYNSHKKNSASNSLEHDLLKIRERFREIKKNYTKTTILCNIHSFIHSNERHHNSYKLMIIM